jgi:hypothetical protein
MSQLDTRETSTITPAIVGVVDGNCEYVEREGTTSKQSMNFMLVGTSSPNGQVEILRQKNEQEWQTLGNTTVNAAGSWHMASGLSKGDSGSFKAKDLQSGGCSDIYKITVVRDLGQA